MFYKSAIELVGNTPLLELRLLEKKYNLKAKLYGKLEYFNPAGSVKDRIAMQMIFDAKDAGILNENSIILEATSGNTGIGLASIATMLGYKCVIVMPENMSVERIKTMKAYGAEVILTEASKGMKGALAKANELKEANPNVVIMGQFVNPSNPKVHEATTGREIYKDLDGKVDMLVAGIGTGGTITGTAKFLKSKIKDIEVVGVEPASSAVLSGEAPGKHKIQGIGAGFVPDVLNLDLVDRIVKVENEAAYEFSREMGKVEGVLVGISSGAALKAAIVEASKEENKDKNIVVIFPDGGARYLSTDLYE
ncbi:MAG: cysteine synthase A [Bacilli bacterium]|nr:cysteine synthase A [Bacilli bacterium]